MAEGLKVYLLDILSILLPGALLLAILSKFYMLREAFLYLFPSLDDSMNLAIYLGIAYMLGHFVFLLGSLLDGWIYENVQKVFWPDHTLPAYVIQLKNEKTGFDNRNALNAFKWSCAWLMANKPEMYRTVERHIAESKFFRSNVIVLFIAVVVFVFIKSNTLLGTISLLLMMLSLVRYLTQRHKSIDTAYQFVITASGEKFDSYPDQSILHELDKHMIRPCQRDKHGPGTGTGEGGGKGLICYLRKLWVVFKLCLNPFYSKR